jgi:hypothetical protein
VIIMRNTLFRQTLSIIFSVVLLLFCSAVYAENIDPNDDGSQYAYGVNVGWLNAEPDGDGGPGVEVSDFELTGYIWAENIGWVSLSCENTSSCGDVSYGVTNDGMGNLSGYGWAENAGWISFSCENTGSCYTAVDYGVTIDPATGEFSGHAWGENIGWITFRSTGAVAFGVTTSWGSDADGDGVPDHEDNCPDTPNPGQEDSDGDTFGDACDNCPSDPNKTEPGICGCGVADTDSDNDGTPDCNDNCPSDPNKTEPGICGCGVADTDSDNDGTPDCNDNCPNSDLSATVIIDACDSGVANTFLSPGCTISDSIAECAAGARNHGEFMSCIAKLTNELKKAGVITGQEKGAIQRCAGQADIP